MFSKLYIPGIALVAFGYPMTTVTLLMTGLSVGPVNQMLKAAYAGLFVISIAGSMWHRRTRIPLALLPLLMFFGVYGFRLIFDIFLRGVYAPLSSPIYVLSYFFLMTVMPSLAIAMAYERADLKALNRWIYAVLFLSCLMVFLFFLQSGTELLMSLASQRLEVRDEGEEIASLNPITIGICGAALSLLSMANFATGKCVGRRLIFIVVGLVLGLVGLLLSGSRGPLLSFLVGTSFLFLRAVWRHKPNGMHQQSSKRIFLVMVAIFGSVIYTAQENDGPFLAVTRLLETATQLQNSGHREVRFDIAADALKSFAESPIIGKSYLALDGTAYAHNSVLEALMATGIVGGTLFISSWLIFFVGVMKASTMKLEPMSYPLAVVSIAMITLSLVSMSLSQSPEIWLMVVLMLTIAARSKMPGSRQRGADRHTAGHG